jgi:hypothetical protein
MPDQFSEVTKTGYGKRITDSIKGILFGVILFFASFVVLFWNEGRVNMSKVAADAQPIDATQVQTGYDSAFVAATGILSTSDSVGDKSILFPADYLLVERTVDMYSWVEESSSKSDIKTGGSEETQTTYSYKKEWTNTPQDSSKFKVAEGHFNPAKLREDGTFKATNITLGAYNINPENFVFPPAVDLALDEETVSVNTPEEIIENKYAFFGGGTYENPEIGDIRISYKAVFSGEQTTVFAKASGTNLVTYGDKDGNTLYRAFEGDKQSALRQMNSEYKTSIWIFRVIGFLMMWIGLSALLGPISTVLDVLPILGSVSRSVVKLITLVISLVLSVVTVVASMIFHSLIAVIVCIVVAAIVVFVVLKMKKK